MSTRLDKHISDAVWIEAFRQYVEDHDDGTNTPILWMQPKDIQNRYKSEARERIIARLNRSEAA